MVDSRANNPGFRLSLAHCLYAVAVLSAYLATFGPSGVWLAGAVIALWAIVFASERRARTLAIAIVPFLLVVGCCGGLYPIAYESRELTRRYLCSNNFEHIGLALEKYHADFGSFPPAYICDSSGKPMHSWRVLILPYLEQSTLYNQYRFDEPWNGPNNAKLASPAPAVYQCLSRRYESDWTPTSTSYVAVVGNGTVWPGSSVRTLEDVADGAPNTLLVTESDSPLSNWMEPKDLTAAEAIQMLSRPGARHSHHSDTFFYKRTHRRNAAFVDGRFRHLSSPFPAALAEKVLTIDDGGPPDGWHEHTGLTNADAQVDYGNVFRLGLLLAITGFPILWVRRRPSSVKIAK